MIQDAFTVFEEGATNSATFSPCRSYRYDLWRRWGKEGFCMFIGLNPSTADENLDDPTVRRCIDYAKRWGYGALCMMNLFAYRATQPRDMMAVAEPIGPENDAALLAHYKNAGVVVAAWGNDGGFQGRDKQVMAMLPELHYLKLNAGGAPAHPLYLRATLVPKPFFPSLPSAPA